VAAALYFVTADADVRVELVRVSKTCGGDEAYLLPRQEFSKAGIATEEFMNPRRNKNLARTGKARQAWRWIDVTIAQGDENAGEWFWTIRVQSRECQAAARS